MFDKDIIEKVDAIESGQSTALQGMDLWCAVYDGPIWWQGRTAFEQIDHLRAALELIASIPDETCNGVVHQGHALRALGRD